MGATFSLKIKMSSAKLIILTIFCISVTHATFVAEIRTLTANCADCGMTFLGDFSITIYHALSDGGKFDNVKVITNSYQELSCDFERFLDGSDWENGHNCQVSNLL